MHEFLNNLTENWNVHNVSNSFNTYFPNTGTIFYLKPSLEVRTVKIFIKNRLAVYIHVAKTVSAQLIII